MKFDEANQTIGVLRFENNFLAKKTKNSRQNCSKSELSWKGLQVQSLMRCSVFRNLLFDRISWGYDFSSPSIASASTTIFVPLSNNVEFENNDVQNVLASENIENGKSILGAPLK